MTRLLSFEEYQAVMRSGPRYRPAFKSEQQETELERMLYEIDQPFLEAQAALTRRETAEAIFEEIGEKSRLVVDIQSPYPAVLIPGEDWQALKGRWCKR